MTVRTEINQHFKRSIDAAGRIKSHLFQLAAFYEKDFPGYSGQCLLLAEAALLLEEGLKDQFKMLDSL